MSGASRINKEEIWEPRQKIIQMAGFSEQNFSNFCRNNDIEGVARGSYTYYPLYAILRTMNTLRKSSRSTAGTTDLDMAKKYEEVTKLRIINQQKMGALIPRDRARNRVLTLLSAFAQKLRYTLKNTAAQVVGMQDARAVENILTQNYNGVIEMLEVEAKILSWSEDGLSSELGRTELPANSGEDSGDGGDLKTEAPSEE